MENLKTDLEQDEVFVFTPKGRVIPLPVGSTSCRLRLRRAHRCRSRLHRRQGQRPARAARYRAAQRRHLRDLHVEGRVRRAVARLVAVRRLAAGPQQDSAMVQPRAASRHDRGRARGADQGVPSRRSAAAADLGQQGARRGDRGTARTPISIRCWPAIGEHHISARSDRSAGRPRISARRRRRTVLGRLADQTRHAAPAAIGRSVCTSRAWKTSWYACPVAAHPCRATTSSASSRVAAVCRCIAPTAPTPRA